LLVSYSFSLIEFECFGFLSRECEVLADSLNLVVSLPVFDRVLMVSVNDGVESYEVLVAKVLLWQLELEVDGADLFP